MLNSHYRVIDKVFSDNDISDKKERCAVNNMHLLSHFETF